ncbi:hypothetical protein CONPUDRAFT_165932 [Coniophora puteana RWD-64-598 SS2]|uniref:Uncharacterized protein n=1 Tax=Coniophora puteana (strain RWD-64-598) TaxID=741705 RepID=A0A5M3MMR8_CONPW|nr:uncharacterized protein CONPUDRAFT_165932 [Coniophora puteana RWD-64-598 SS2]EIW80403.1 hypothetical protein CONPUDRAFT_165932 [Coniophora puteana RWD-64-598 SS2]
MHSHPSFAKLALYRDQRRAAKAARSLDSTRPSGVSKLNRIGKLFRPRKHVSHSLFRSIHERDPTPHRPRSVNLRSSSSSRSSSNMLSEDEVLRQNLASRRYQADQPPQDRFGWFRTSPQPLDVHVRRPPADTIFSPSRSEPRNLRSLATAAHESMVEVPPLWSFPYSPSAFCLRHYSDWDVTDELGRSLGRLTIRNPDCEDEQRDDCELLQSPEAYDMSCDSPADALAEARRKLGMSCDQAAISTMHSGSRTDTGDTSSFRLSDLMPSRESIGMSCVDATISTVWTEPVPDNVAQPTSRFSETPEGSPMAISPPRITITSTNASSEKPYQPPPIAPSVPVPAAAPSQRRHLGELTNQNPAVLEMRKRKGGAKPKSSANLRARVLKKSADDPFTIGTATTTALVSTKSLPSVKFAFASPPPVPRPGHGAHAYLTTRYPHTPETPTPRMFSAGHGKSTTTMTLRKRAVSDSKSAKTVQAETRAEGGKHKTAALLARPFVLPPFRDFPHANRGV